MPKFESESAVRVRWWPVSIILALTALAIGLIWNLDISHRQEQVMLTILAVGVLFMMMLLWLLFLSRLRLKIRLVAFVVIALISLLSVAVFRIRGVSGDFLPLLEWRWSKRVGESLTANPGATSRTLDKASSVSPHDYPQFLGPNRNATVHSIKLARDWSARPPRLMWRQPIGAGWSAFAVVGNSAVTQEQNGEYEMVVCYDLKSGRVKWSHRDHDKYESTIAGDGPRATPTIVVDRVYTLGGTGILNCLELATGEQIWSQDILYDNNAEMSPWGMSCSPLVMDGLVIVSAGGPAGRSLVAYHTDTGERIWSGGDAPSGYSSPVLTTLAGVPQILIFNYGSVAAHDPGTGQILWQRPWPQTECVSQPVPLLGDRVFVSTGYGIGCKLFQIQRSGYRHPDGIRTQRDLQVSLIWETRRLKAKLTNIVYRDGYIYGLDDGVLVCLDIVDGQRKWKRGRYGHGQVILIDPPDETEVQSRLLLVQAESGNIVLVEVNSNAPKELARFAALDSKTWNNPALAGPYLLVRNDREAACYELPLE
jgi:outer membrane protein assembly factor BamB